MRVRTVVRYQFFKKKFSFPAKQKKDHFMNTKSLLKRIAIILISSTPFFSCDDANVASPAEKQEIKANRTAHETELRKKPLVLLGGTKGVFETSSLGQSFEMSSKGLSGNSLIVQAFLEHNQVIFAGTKNGVYVSKNNGKSWAPSNVGMGGDGLNVVSLFEKGNVIYAGSFGGGIYVSSSGRDWTTLNNGLNDGALIVRSIIEHNGSIYIGTHHGVYKLNNTGTGWLSVNSGLEFVNDLTVVGLASTTNSIYAATFGGLLKELRDDAFSWVTLSNGFPEGFVNAVAVVGDKLYVGGNTYGVFVYDGNTFEPFNSGLPSSNMKIRAFAGRDNEVLMSTINGGTYYTTDGLTWIANSGEADNADYWGLFLR
jgi:hypothetical protein